MKTKQYSLGEFREKLSNCLCRKRPSSKIDGNYYYVACFDCEYSSVSDTAEETINHWNLIIIEERREKEKEEKKEIYKECTDLRCRHMHCLICGGAIILGPVTNNWRHLYDGSDANNLCDKKNKKKGEK